MDSGTTPPRIALDFFRWFCRPDYLEEIEGDLTESYQNNCGKYGYRKANRLFYREVVLLFRPSMMGNICHLIRTKTSIMSPQNKRLITILTAVPVLLTIPFIGMQLSPAVDWKISDFAVMAVLLLGTGLLCEFVLRKARSTKARFVLCAVVLLIFILLWAELAVGIVN